jgi:periplasmic divalent cation tolerance protein
MKISLVYITIDSYAAAEILGKKLIEENLAACVNILPGMTSFYRWQGAIETAKETVMIAKTQTGLVDKLTARVKSLHSYMVPCVVAMPIEGGNPDFIKWVKQETSTQE